MIDQKVCNNLCKSLLLIADWSCQSGDGNRDVVSIKPKEMDDKLIEDGNREVDGADNNKMW